MKTIRNAILAAVLLAAGGRAAWAAEEAAPAVAQAPMTGLKKQTGVIELKGANAKLETGKDFYFLDAGDAKRVLTEAWGNPPDAVTHVLGMLIPARLEPDQEGAWGAVVTYQDIGYVEDSDARSTDYDKLLAQMREGEDQENAALRKQGYPGIHLAGWAEAPSYDAANHVLIWARDLAVEGSKVDSLNYDIRVLGRHGVLSLNVVGAMSDLSAVRQAAASVRQTAAFDPGARYTDVDKSRDRMAGIGVAGLIAAGAGAAVAKKAGLLGLLIVFGKKALVFIVAGFAALAAWFRRTFGAKPMATASAYSPEPEPEPPAEAADAAPAKDEPIP